MGLSIHCVPQVTGGFPIQNDHLGMFGGTIILMDKPKTDGEWWSQSYWFRRVLSPTPALMLHGKNAGVISWIFRRQSSWFSCDGMTFGGWWLTKNISDKPWLMVITRVVLSDGWWRLTNTDGGYKKGLAGLNWWLMMINAHGRWFIRGISPTRKMVDQWFKAMLMGKSVPHEGWLVMLVRHYEG